MRGKMWFRQVSRLALGLAAAISMSGFAEQVFNNSGQNNSVIRLQGNNQVVTVEEGQNNVVYGPPAPCLLQRPIDIKTDDPRKSVITLKNVRFNHEPLPAPLAAIPNGKHRVRLFNLRQKGAETNLLGAIILLDEKSGYGFPGDLKNAYFDLRSANGVRDINGQRFLHLHTWAQGPWNATARVMAVDLRQIYAVIENKHLVNFLINYPVTVWDPNHRQWVFQQQQALCIVDGELDEQKEPAKVKVPAPPLPSPESDAESARTKPSVGEGVPPAPAPAENNVVPANEAVVPVPVPPRPSEDPQSPEEKL